MNREYFQKQGAIGGKKGGKAKGVSKRRSTEHYRMMAKKSAEARRLKRDNAQEHLPGDKAGPGRQDGFGEDSP